MATSSYRLRATLLAIEPEIWRAFAINGELSLGELHLALQVLFGWRGTHLHLFTNRDPSQRPPVGQARQWGDSLSNQEMDLEPEVSTTVADAFADGGSIWYEYDFGDGWLHRIDLVDSFETPLVAPPVGDVDGANRGPFENAGGTPGYAEKLAIAADPQHPEHSFITDWIRSTVGPWAPTDPKFFDPLGTQSELNMLFNPHLSGNHPHDMSGLVKDNAHRGDGDLQIESALVDFASDLPVPIRSELRQHLHRTGVLEPTHLDEDTAGRIIRPYLWLVEHVGSGGLTLTQAQRMPPTSVFAAMTDLGWAENWVGTGNREDHTAPVANLREIAQRMGLVRVLKGRLVLGADAKRALGDPKRLLRIIARRLFRGLPEYHVAAGTLQLLAIADGTPPDERWRAVSFGLGMLGYASADGQDFTPRQIHGLTRPINDALSVLTWHQHRALVRGEADEPAELMLFAREALRV